MADYQIIKIEGVSYFILDSIQDFRAEDSFIHKDNKLSRFTGNGESKKHIGTYNGEIGKGMSTFFNYSKWGLEHKDPNKNNWKTFNSAVDSGALISNKKCFFSKSNMLKYLADAEREYISQEQDYHNNIGEFYSNRLKEINELKSNHLYFSIYDASDNKSQKQNRGYIRSDDKIWKIWRKLVLPSISYLSILKLVPIKNIKAEPFFYFRILLDYQFRSFIHPSEISQADSRVKTVDKEKSKTKYRKGQSEYRKSVIDYMPQCPFTKITDERLLIASHIKPYSVCVKEKNEEEALDYLNGLSLAPTYDRLFDQGYITFLNDGTLICGTQLSPYTWSKVNLNPNAKNVMRIFPEKREKYLEYHRNKVFQDSIEDLI